MKITIVYDNNVYKKDIGLKSDWGFSCLINTEDETILFDTGSNGKILLDNMEKLGIDPGEIEKIVISHEHYDHNGGLAEIAPLVGKAVLYRLCNEQPCGNIDIISIEEPMKIIKGVYSTGKLGQTIKEQSLILKEKYGCTVLVGCAHPGVEGIFNAASQYGSIAGLIGGLHGFNNFSLLEELDFVCFCHCALHERKILELFPKTSFKGGVGKILEL